MLLRSVIQIALFLFVINAVAITYIVTGTREIKKNTDRAEVNTRRIEMVEKLDTVSARSAAYRICEREQRGRAEQQFRAQAFAASTKILLRQLNAPPALSKSLTLKSLRQRLPIFDCEPNLRGQGARVLSSLEQDRYVMRYALGQLDPNPRQIPASPEPPH